MLEEMIDKIILKHMDKLGVRFGDKDRWRYIALDSAYEICQEIRTRCNEFFEVDELKLCEFVKEISDFGEMNDLQVEQYADVINQASLIKPKEKA